jgi:hypothetical protein
LRFAEGLSHPLRRRLCDKCVLWFYPLSAVKIGFRAVSIRGWEVRSLFGLNRGKWA